MLRFGRIGALPAKSQRSSRSARSASPRFEARGLFLGCLLGGQSLQELRTALAVAETEIYGGISPRVAPFADVRDMGGLLQRAGFALPVADSEPITVRYATCLA